VLKEIKVPKGTRIKPLTHLVDNNEEEYKSDFLEDCDILYATLLAGGEAKEIQGYGTL
jgi:hypothetical protein